MGSGRGPITQSLQTNCTLESTLSRIFLLLELRYVGGGGGVLSFPVKTHADVRVTPKKTVKLSALFAIIEILSCGQHVTQTIEDHSFLVIGYYRNISKKSRGRCF